MRMKRADYMTIVAVRLPSEWLARADQLVIDAPVTGLIPTRSAILRSAMRRGLELMEAENVQKKGGFTQ